MLFSLSTVFVLFIGESCYIHFHFYVLRGKVSTATIFRLLKTLFPLIGISEEFTVGKGEMTA